MANLIYLRSTTSLTPAFTPASLFASGEEGAWYEPSTTTAFKSTTDLTPCGYGDGAGFLLDKSKGAGYSGGSFTGLGSETVTNGAFSTDLSGWTTTAWVWDASGRASLNTTTNFLTIRQNLGLITGKFYLISFDYEVITGSGQIGAEGTNSANILFGVGSGSIEFVWQVPATGSTVFFRNLTATTEMYIDNISVRELPGNHRTQATTAARPLYALHPVGGVRNELVSTDTLATQNVTVTAEERTLSFKGTGIVTLSGASTAGPLVGTGADDIVSLTFTPTAGTLTLTVTGTVEKAQLEPGTARTNYQTVGSTFLDVSEEGKARRGRLWYNGTSHFMETGTITPGTDKVQVFAGVRKLSDATAIIFEHSANVNSNQGSFHLANIERATTHQFVSKGTVMQIAKPISGANAPTTNILTALGDISGDSAILRIDGIQGAINTGDQGTGNYLAYPIYFGARGASLFFNGYEDTSIVRFGPNLDETTISKVESYVASKTPEPTL